MTLRITLATLASVLVASSASAALSTFNFNTDGDFASSGPAQMGLLNDIPFGSFDTDTINGASTGVYSFPAATPMQGLVVTTNAAANGGGSYVNEYTLGYDIKFVNASGYASLFQTDVSNTSDGDLFRNGSGGLGISSKYAGSLQSDTWYRLMFTFDLANKTLNKYVNGSLAGTQTLSAGTDGRWSLNPTFLILTDNDGETNAGELSSFSFEDRALSASEVAAYGGPTASGISAVPEPSSLALLAFGVLPMLRRRKLAKG
jgi:hypothetical protein